MVCQTGAFRDALSIFFLNHMYHLFKKKKKKRGKRKLINSRFSKVMLLSLKLGAFDCALSPLFGTSKNYSPLFKKKKKRKILFKNKRLLCIKFSNQGHSALSHSSEYKSYQRWLEEFKLFTTELQSGKLKYRLSIIPTLGPLVGRSPRPTPR